MTDTSLNSTRIATSRTKRGPAASSDRGGAAQAPVQLASSHKPSWLILLFMISLAIPSYFFLGTLRLSVYRSILLIMFFPLIFQWLSGKAGQIRAIDFMMIGHGLWIMLALFVAHGAARLEIGGVLMIETAVPFLLARMYIRSADDFAFFIKCVCWVIVALIPLAFIEAMTGRIPLSELLSKFAPVYPDLQDEMRLGMHRAQGTFEHPILFGVFCATLFAPALLVWGHEIKGFGRTMRGLAVGTATFLSLSMGAYISIGIQAALLIWNRVMRNVDGRWTILLGGFLAFYIVVDLFSNRSPINVITSILTFRGGASYNRILIWEYGSAEVWRNPIFGLGFNDWIRLPWMVPSVDNFWLATSMKFGLPALLMIMLPFFISIRKVSQRDFSQDSRLASYRLAYIFGLVGFMLSICTVYVWNATYVFLVFFLGSGIWMWDCKAATSDGPEETGEADEDDQPKYQSARTRPARKERPQRLARETQTRPPRPPRPPRNTTRDRKKR